MLVLDQFLIKITLEDYILSALASSIFNSYRTVFVARPADLSKKDKEDEVIDFSKNKDVYSLSIAPQAEFEIGTPPRKARTSGEKMHLWLVKTDDVAVTLEEGESGASTERGRFAHTNLCGLTDAHCGGELWFETHSRIWLTGGSSRFPPRSDQELSLIVDQFRKSGYEVCSCGWDAGIAGPARFFRGRDTWVGAL